MGKSKRDSASLDYDEPSKRPRHSGNGPPKEKNQGRIDPTYGQRSAFPGLDEDSTFTTEDDDLDYGDDTEALSYLRAVRSEAAGVPTLLVAPKPVLEVDGELDRTIYDDGMGDSRGFYSDGAYTAAPDPQNDIPTDIPLATHLRNKYLEKNLTRFKQLRVQLSNTPPDHIVEKLDQNHDSYMSATAADYRKWRWRVINTEPINAQLAGMDRSTLLKLVRLLTNDKLAMGGNTIPSERLSRWVWGILARLPDKGEMNSEEIGLIRDLGKRAVWLGVVMSQPNSTLTAEMPGDADELDGEGEEDYGENEDGQEDEQEDEQGALLNSEPDEGIGMRYAGGAKAEVGNRRSHTTDQVLKRHTYFYDTPTTEEEAKQDQKSAISRSLCFWGDTPYHIMVQFHNKGCDSMGEYKGHVPKPEIYHILCNDDGNRTAEELARAKERLRNFYRRNPKFARFRFRFSYQKNPWAEQYDGPLPPRWIDDAYQNAGRDHTSERVQEAHRAWKEFVLQHTDYKYALFGCDLQSPGESGTRDRDDDKNEDEAFDRAWRVAGLATPQTRIYDDGRDEEEEIASEKPRHTDKTTLAAVAEECGPEREKDEEETLESARDRVLAQLGEAIDRNAVDLARAREALKEQEFKEQTRRDEEDAARLMNAKATVDMIITVAGEMYGQRDLLEFRETWD